MISKLKQIIVRKWTEKSLGKTEKVLGRQKKSWEDRKSQSLGKTEKVLGRQKKSWEDRKSFGAQ